MNKFLWIALLIFAAPVFVFAQYESKKSEQWETFAPLGEEFSAEVPASVLTKEHGKKSRFYSAFAEDAYFLFSPILAKTLSMRKKFRNSPEATNR